MSNTISSTYMNLPVPVVGVDPGPQWGTDLNSCLTLIDQHNHSAGSGVQINPSGLNINVDLPMNSNNLVLTRSVRYVPQGAPLALPTDLGCTYVVGVDLYYNDVTGNQIRLTQGGSIVGTTGSITGLTSPASASYVAVNQTFVWQSAANTPANLDAASIILRNLSVNSKGLTLSPPLAMGSNYSITLPALPSATSFLTMSTSGVIQNYSATATSILGRASNSAGPLADIVSTVDDVVLTRSSSALSFSKATLACISPVITPITSNYTTTSIDNYLKLTASGGAFTVTLHTPSFNQLMILERTDTTFANQITISGTISGASNWKMCTAGETLQLMYSTTDSEWKCVSHYAQTDWVNTGAIVIGAETTAPTKGTVGVDQLWYRRSGRDIYLKLIYNQTALGSAANGSGQYFFTIPATVDTSIIPAVGGPVDADMVNTSNVNSIIPGSAFISNSGARGQGVPVLRTSTTFSITATQEMTTGTAVYGSAIYGMANATTGFNVSVGPLPILGWKA